MNSLHPPPLPPFLASLPMYDLPELRQATDAFWQALAQELGHPGMPLTRSQDWSAPWHSPNLLFSQTCGYPFTHAFAGKLTYVATPHYAADGCHGPLYRSVLLARECKPLESFRNASAAFNSSDSMSGMLALKLVFAPLARDGRFFAHALETGSHAASIAAVQSGRADVCAIDCVTLALLRRYRPQSVEGLQEIARSAPVPGLPFVTRCQNVVRLQAALQAVFADPANHTILDSLLLTSLSLLQPSAYNVIPELEAALAAEGGLDLTTR